MSAPVVTPQLVEALRADLTDVGYTVEAVESALGPLAARALHREQALPARRVTEGSQDPVLVLVRLFTLGCPVPEALVDRVLPRTGAAGLRALGLVDHEPPATPDVAAQVRATVDLRPYGDEQHAWWVVSDLGELALGHALPTDHVLGIGGASTTLAS